MSLKNDSTKKPKPQDTQIGDLKNLSILPENSSRGLWSRREHCWGYVSGSENTNKKLILKSIFPLKVATTLLCGARMCYMLTIQALTLKPLGTMPQEPWHPGQGAKLDHVIHFNCGKVWNHASCKTTRKWESFNNREAKMSLRSDELWLIARVLQTGAKSIISSNLGLCKRSEIYLI